MKEGDIVKSGARHQWDNFYCNQADLKPFFREDNTENVSFAIYKFITSTSKLATLPIIGLKKG